MTSFRRLFLSTFLLFFLATISKGQDAHFSQFYANPIYLIDSLDYLLIDTSVIRIDSPIKNLDIKEIRLDSIKLDDILLEFENGV